MHITTFYYDICQHMQKPLALICVYMVLCIFCILLFLHSLTQSVCIVPRGLEPSANM